MHRPLELETIILIESARTYSYVSHQKGCKWKEQENEAIVNVYPKFYTIPDIELEHFETFCWSTLLLYKHFHDIEVEIGLTKEQILKNSNKFIVFKINDRNFTFELAFTFVESSC